MSVLNLGIVAHVDAGKTSLTERLLHTAGVIDRLGSVDAGSTQTDTLAVERARGITVRSAVVSFPLHGVAVNLIDTPGHPDFIAEVERVLSVLDGAVLVVSAVEGVQPQTRILYRALHRLAIPTLVFVNKIDRSGADPDRVTHEIRTRLSPDVLPITTALRPGSRDAAVTARDDTAGLAEVLTRHDDTLLATYLRDGRLTPAALHTALASQTATARVHPLLHGSAITGAGTPELTHALTTLLPATTPSPDQEPAGTIFKIERGPAGEKIAYLRLFTGVLHTRTRLPLRGHTDTITAITTFTDGTTHPQHTLTAGHIGKLTGLTHARIGDTIGSPPTTTTSHHFTPPTLETHVTATHSTDTPRLHTALTQITEQDPLINLRNTHHHLTLTLYGEIQKEIIHTTLQADYNIPVTFHDTTTIHTERPDSTGAAAEFNGAEGNPFLATVGLRVEPADNSEVEFRIATEVRGTMPLAFYKAIEETVSETLEQGLYGWQVTHCRVTLTHTGYSPRQSHAHQGFDKSMSSTGADFRLLTPLVLMAALKRAGTTVCEPMHRYLLEVPTDTLPAVLPVLAKLQATPQAPRPMETSYTLEGYIPARHIHTFQQELPGLTHGEGTLETTFHDYQPVRAGTPTRPRTDRNPLDRKEYLLHVQRRV